MQMGDASQGVNHDGDLVVQLGFGSHVLPLATTASGTHARARWLDTPWRRPQDGDGSSPSEVMAVLDDLGVDRLTRQRTLDEDHLAVAQSPDGVPAGGQPGELHLDRRMLVSRPYPTPDAPRDRSEPPSRRHRRWLAGEAPWPRCVPNATGRRGPNRRRIGFEGLDDTIGAAGGDGEARRHMVGGLVVDRSAKRKPSPSTARANRLPGSMSTGCAAPAGRRSPASHGRQAQGGREDADAACPRGPR